ncbi:Trypan-PARP domain containing protein [Pyrenophora tritici-repentis]|uniref:Trypan-PARP domain containing protein n=1 Tax=Pyrenophora tritici-repentis TaxID=45151 RepID=A0A834S2A0_9PLEO|nr:Trypan-PARP domain containing protein [Pyrenophora tritici-repentis]
MAVHEEDIRRPEWSVEYVNPDLSPERLKMLEDERPKELEVRRFRNPLTDEQIDIPDLTATELATYNSWARRFDRDEARWLTKEKALRNLSLEIVQTIDVKHLDLILDCADAYSQLRTLKKHLCPSIGERNHQLRARYTAVCTRPKTANLDTWFDEWVTITRLLTEAKMPETTGNRAQEEFILSIRGLDDSWAATQLQDLIKKEQKDEEFPLIADLIAEFRSYYRRTRPIASGLGTFATLEVASSGNSQGARTRSGPWIPRCLDGENHKFDNCPYVNQSVRTKGWKPDKAIQDKFTELRDSPTAGLKKKTKPQAEVQSSSMISIDDGQPARNKPHVNAVLQTAAATGLSAPPLLTRWMPALGRVLRTRDVAFMSSDGTEPVYPDRQILREVVTTLDVPEPVEETDQEIELLLQSAQEDWSGLSWPEQAARTEQAKDTSHALSTPESTLGPTTRPEPEPEPEPEAVEKDEPEAVERDEPEAVERDEPEAVERDELETVEMPRGWEQMPVEAEAPDRRTNNAPRREETSGQVSESNVLTGKRQRKTLGTYFVAFAKALQQTEPQKSRLHRDELPPPPKRWKDLEKHPFGQEFKAAAAKEFKSRRKKGCFKTTLASVVDSQRSVTKSTTEAELIALSATGGEMEWWT